MIWCFSISRLKKNYRKWTAEQRSWETFFSFNQSGSACKYTGTCCRKNHHRNIFQHINLNLSVAKMIKMNFSLCLYVDWFSLPFNESNILNHPTIVTNSMPNPFSSFHISHWWCLKSVGVHKWLHWPWFIWWTPTHSGQLTSRYISCFLTWNNKTLNKTSNR